MNQLGFFPSRKSDHRMADAFDRSVAAICAKDWGTAVKMISAKESASIGVGDLCASCASNAGAGVAMGGVSSAATRHVDRPKL